MLALVVWVLLAGSLSFALLCWLYRRRHSQSYAGERNLVRLCAVVGSGGHTTEMLSLVEVLSDSYSPRLYIIAKSDRLSFQKVLQMEQDHGAGEFSVTNVGRSREVMQSYLTSVYTTLLAFFESLWIVYSNPFDLLLCNGPGTCIPVCIAAALFDLLRLRDIKIVYFESICRVRRLSLSGLILYYLRIPDLIAVHWPDLAEKYPRTRLVESLNGDQLG